MVPTVLHVALTVTSVAAKPILVVLPGVARQGTRVFVEDPEKFSTLRICATKVMVFLLLGGSAFLGVWGLLAF